MDVLISANESVLQLMRSIPRDLENGESREQMAEWFKQMDEGSSHGGNIQEVTV